MSGADNVSASLVSGAVDATGFVITRTANTDVNALQIAGGLMWDTGCGSGYTNNFCGGIYYYDGEDVITFPIRELTDVFA